jgi:hypothetical protein
MSYRDSTEPFPCRDCSQLIQFHQGLNKVVNMGDGSGGQIGEDHICPARVGSRYHHWDKPKEINYWTHKHHPSSDCPFNVPMWVKLHYYSITRLGKCTVENCPCIETEKMKDPDLKAESDRKHKEWMEKWESQPLSFERFK